MIKYIAAAFWAFGTCFFLWFFAYIFALPSNNALSQNLLESHNLVASYLLFTIVLTLGGASYYVMTKIIDAPYHVEDKDHWLRLTNYLFAALIAPCFTITAMTVVYEMPFGIPGYQIFISSMTVSWVLSVYFMRKAVKKMQEMQLLGQIRSRP